MNAVTFLFLLNASTSAAFNLASRPAGRGAEAAVVAATSTWRTLRSGQRMPPMAAARKEAIASSCLRCDCSFFVTRPPSSLLARPAGAAIGQVAIDAAMVSAAAARAQPRSTLSKRPAGVVIETFAVTAARAAAAAQRLQMRQQHGNA